MRNRAVRNVPLVLKNSSVDRPFDIPIMVPTIIRNAQFNMTTTPNFSILLISVSLLRCWYLYSTLLSLVVKLLFKRKFQSPGGGAAPGWFRKSYFCSSIEVVLSKPKVGGTKKPPSKEGGENPYRFYFRKDLAKVVLFVATTKDAVTSATSCPCALTRGKTFQI